MTDSYFRVYIKHINSDMMKRDMAWEEALVAIIVFGGICFGFISCCRQMSPTSMFHGLLTGAASKSEYVHPRVDTINGTGCFVIDDSSPDNLICNAYKDPFGNVYKDPL